MCKRLALALLCALATCTAYAGSISGVIQTVNVNLLANLVYVQFVGAPVMNGDGCASYWTANSMDEEKFMKFVYPMLLAAKASGTTVTVGYYGCNGVYPKINSVDFEPRLVN